jgi:hypothetical protein
MKLIDIELFLWDYWPRFTMTTIPVTADLEQCFDDEAEYYMVIRYFNLFGRKIFKKKIWLFSLEEYLTLIHGERYEN